MVDAFPGVFKSLQVCGGSECDTESRFAQELKEAGIIEIKWTSGDDMTSDLFTKNLSGPTFEKHASKFVGEDEYMKAGKETSNSRRESVGG